MAKYTCHTCGTDSDKPLNLCNPILTEVSTLTKEQAGPEQSSQKLGRYICGGCGNIATSPDNLCHPENF